MNFVQVAVGLIVVMVVACGAKKEKEKEKESGGEKASSWDADENVKRWSFLYTDPKEIEDGYLYGSIGECLAIDLGLRDRFEHTREKAPEDFEVKLTNAVDRTCKLDPILKAELASAIPPSLG